MTIPGTLYNVSHEDSDNLVWSEVTHTWKRLEIGDYVLILEKNDVCIYVFVPRIGRCQFYLEDCSNFVRRERDIERSR